MLRIRENVYFAKNDLLKVIICKFQVIISSGGIMGIQKEICSQIKINMAYRFEIQKVFTKYQAI